MNIDVTCVHKYMYVTQSTRKTKLNQEEKSQVKVRRLPEKGF